MGGGKEGGEERERKGGREGGERKKEGGKVVRVCVTLQVPFTVRASNYDNMKLITGHIFAATPPATG